MCQKQDGFLAIEDPFGYVPFIVGKKVLIDPAKAEIPRTDDAAGDKMHQPDSLQGLEKAPCRSSRHVLHGLGYPEELLPVFGVVFRARFLSRSFCMASGKPVYSPAAACCAVGKATGSPRADGRGILSYLICDGQ